jgi:hypothetical protein
MQLNLSQEQLNFLVFVQMLDDWHCTAFIEVVAEQYQKSKPFDTATFESTAQELKKLSTEKIAMLQSALNILGDL